MPTTSIRHNQISVKKTPDIILQPQINSKFELIKKFNKCDIITKSGGYGSPSIIEWQNELLMVYQEPIIGIFFKPPRKAVYLCKLEKDFSLNKTNIQNIEFAIDYQKYIVADVRFFIFSGELWYSGIIVEANNVENYQRLFICKYDKDCQNKQKILVINYDKGNPKKEKNWAFFEHGSRLMATYSTWNYKHNIVEIDPKTGNVSDIYQHDISLPNCSQLIYKLFKDVRPTANYVNYQDKLYGTYHVKYGQLYKNICGIYTFNNRDLYLNFDYNDYLIDDKYRNFSIYFPIGLFIYNNILYTSIGVFKANRNCEGTPHEMSLEIWRYHV